MAEAVDKISSAYNWEQPTNTGDRPCKRDVRDGGLYDTLNVVLLHAGIDLA